MNNRTEQAQQIQRIEGWRDALEELNAHIAPRFARPEVRARVGRYLFGLLGPVERKNGWQMAEHLAERTPDGVQRLPTPARWAHGRLAASNGSSTPLVGTTERCETTYASVRGGVLRRSGSDPGDRRDELLEEGRKVGGSGPSVLGHCREGGELPGRSVFGLHGA